MQIKACNSQISSKPLWFRISRTSTVGLCCPFVFILHAHLFTPAKTLSQGRIQEIPSRELTYPPKNGILKMIFLFPRWDIGYVCSLRVKPFSSLHSSRVSDLSPWTTWHCTHLWRARGSSVPAAPRIRPLSWSKYLVLSSDLSKTQHPRMGLENLWPNQKCGNPWPTEFPEPAV